MITGSRTWKWKGPIQGLMQGFAQSGVTFIAGGASRGVDKFVAEISREFQYDYIEVPADWDTHGKAAGMIRNGDMVKMKPDVCFAFRSEGPSNGTDDCVYQANIAGIPTYVMRRMPDLSATGFMVPGTKQVKTHGNK